MKNAFKYGAVALGLLFGLGSAHAASTWVFSGSSTADGLGDGGYKANTSYATNGVASLTISGAYATNGSTTTNGVTTQTSGYASGAAWQTAAPNATLNYYSGNGLAMCSDPQATGGCSAPNHALDNNGNTEAVLFGFSSSVALTSIGIGYVSGDADISVFRYVCPGGATTCAAPTLTGVGAALGTMTAAGWSLVGNYGNLGVDTTDPYNLINGATTSGGTDVASASSVSSSWWLVTAYNSSYGASSNGQSVDEGNDYFKIYSVAGVASTAGNNNGTPPNKVPEPGSLALAGLALFGVVATRRQIRKS